MKKITLKNFRDLHYLKGPNGLRLKKGLIFRSGVLNDLSRLALQKLNRLRLDEIVDLRGEEEVLAMPDTPSEAPVVIAEFHNPEYAPEPDGIDRAAIQTYLDNRRCDDAVRQREVDFYTAIYSRNIYHNDGIKEIFRLMKEHKAFLFHCRGGKDRTGVTALLILSALGFPKEAIIRDYLKTNNPFLVFLAKYGLKIAGFNQNGIDAVFVNSFAQKELIEATFKEIEANCQSVENFLFREYGITDEMLNDFKAFYLE